MLKNVVASALADYAEAESIYELSLLEAQTDYDTQKISASYASSIRNTSSSSVANNVTSLQVQLEQKQANAASLQEKLAAAQAKQKINQLDMEETYQETVITGQNAQTTYNATVEDLKETLQEAEETKEKRVKHTKNRYGAPKEPAHDWHLLLNKSPGCLHSGFLCLQQ